jgi:acetyl-CoA C-acetyltransferase
MHHAGNSSGLVDGASLMLIGLKEVGKLENQER